MKAINFLAKHGLNPVLKNDSKEFDKAWVEFLIAGEEFPTEWPQRLVDISIKWVKQKKFLMIMLVILLSTTY